MSKPKKLRRIVKRAKMGNPYAIYKLGLCYYEGLYVEKDEYIGAELIAVAAATGYAPAEEWIEDYKFDDDAFVQANA